MYSLCDAVYIFRPQLSVRVGTIVYATPVAITCRRLQVKLLAADIPVQNDQDRAGEH